MESSIASHELSKTGVLLFPAVTGLYRSSAWRHLGAGPCSGAFRRAATAPPPTLSTSPTIERVELIILLDAGHDST
jgi:hypothetical protein